MRELRSGLFFFGLSLFVILESLRIRVGTYNEPGAGFLSFCAGVILAVLSLMLIQSGWGLRESMKPHPRRVILALVSLFAYCLVLESIGFLVATFLLVGVLLRLGEPRRWFVLVATSAFVTFLAYLVFGILLHVHFPRSFLGV
jgi:hypothetical protein